MVLLAGGLVVYKMSDKSDEPEVIEEKITQPAIEKKHAAPILQNAPPPPPSEKLGTHVPSRHCMRGEGRLR